MMKFAIPLIAVMLSGCCTDGTESDCTEADRQKIAELRAPVLVTEQDGVRLWRIRDRGEDVWFTSPCGDTSWTKTRKLHLPRQVNGQGCKL